MMRLAAASVATALALSLSATSLAAEGQCTAEALQVKMSPKIARLLDRAEAPPFGGDICALWRQELLGPRAPPPPPQPPRLVTTTWSVVFEGGVLDCKTSSDCKLPKIADVTLRPLRSEGRVNVAEIALLPGDVRKLQGDQRVRQLIPSCMLSAPTDPDPADSPRSVRVDAKAVERGCERSDSSSWGVGDACIPKPGTLDPWDGKTIAILDNGLDCKHDDFQSRIIGKNQPLPGRRCGMDAGRNYVYKGLPPDNCDDSNPPNCSYHGTAVAGITASMAGDLLGVDPHAQLMSSRIILHSHNLPLAEVKSVETAILESAQTAQILNISANWYVNYAGVANAIDQVTKDGTHLVVVSSKAREDETTYPSVYTKCNPAVIAVSDILFEPEKNGRYAWGKDADRDPTFLIAPGDGILTSYSDGSSETDRRPRDGSSFAAPHVAGAASLIWSQDEFKRCSAAAIRQLLWCSARTTVVYPTNEPRKRLHVGCLFGQRDQPFCSDVRDCVESVKLKHCQ